MSIKKFVVTLEETVHYQVTVHAENEEEAMDKAVAIWNDEEDTWEKYGEHGFGVDPVDAELKE